MHCSFRFYDEVDPETQRTERWWKARFDESGVVVEGAFMRSQVKAYRSAVQALAEAPLSVLSVLVEGKQLVSIPSAEEFERAYKSQKVYLK